jgi:hypothetical protein
LVEDVVAQPASPSTTANGTNNEAMKRISIDPFQFR